MSESIGADFLLDATAGELHAVRVGRLFEACQILWMAEQKLQGHNVHMRDVEEHFHVFTEHLGFRGPMFEKDLDSQLPLPLALYFRAFPPRHEVLAWIYYLHEHDIDERTATCTRYAHSLLIELPDALRALDAFFEAVEAGRPAAAHT
ncbi:MAG: hypothetical protein JWN50_792 [Parcubacteria group bacterium]|nr:hypothetical protein [Parcubacteria group bacterium]